MCFVSNYAEFYQSTFFEQKFKLIEVGESHFSLGTSVRVLPYFFAYVVYEWPVRKESGKKTPPTPPPTCSSSAASFSCSSRNVNF